MNPVVEPTSITLGKYQPLPPNKRSSFSVAPTFCYPVLKKKKSSSFLGSMNCKDDSSDFFDNKCYSLAPQTELSAEDHPMHTSAW